MVNSRAVCKRILLWKQNKQTKKLVNKLSWRIMWSKVFINMAFVCFYCMNSAIFRDNSGQNHNCNASNDKKRFILEHQFQKVFYSICSYHKSSVNPARPKRSHFTHLFTWIKIRKRTPEIVCLTIASTLSFNQFDVLVISVISWQLSFGRESV